MYCLLYVRLKDVLSVIRKTEKPTHTWNFSPIVAIVKRFEVRLEMRRSVNVHIN